MRTLNAQLFTYPIDPNNDDFQLSCSRKQCERSEYPNAYGQYEIASDLTFINFPYMKLIPYQCLAPQNLFLSSFCHVNIEKGVLEWLKKYIIIITLKLNKYTITRVFISVFIHFRLLLKIKQKLEFFSPFHSICLSII